ncbi:MAG: thiol peroxidase [Anaerolineales bacterium]|nr:thiol peroxidase [Anaerolineales bacterium]
MIERIGDLTHKGKPVTVIGDKLSVGDKAPSFSLTDINWSTVTLDDSAGKIRLISVVPSLDTGTCDMQTRRFNEEIGILGDNVVGYTVSADLPYAQSRWCGNAGVKNVITLSDHKDMSFGNAYGTHYKERRLEQRAVFVVDEAGVVQYAEYVPEISQHPDYDAALAVLKKLAG